MNDNHWEYVYNATAMSTDNTTHEGACDADSTTCEFEGLSPGTEYAVYIQALVLDYPVGSELSEALIVQTNSEDETGKLKKYNQASAHVWQLKENLATRDTHFLMMIYRSELPLTIYTPPYTLRWPLHTSDYRDCCGMCCGRGSYWQHRNGFGFVTINDMYDIYFPTFPYRPFLRVQ